MNCRGRSLEHSLCPAEESGQGKAAREHQGQQGGLGCADALPRRALGNMKMEIVI